MVGIVLGAVVLLVLGSLLLSAWILAEEAELAPPVGPTVEAAAERWSGRRSASSFSKSTPGRPFGSAAPERCPATLFVETADGEPVEGSVLLWGEEDWVPLGPDGDADWPMRRCGQSDSVRVRDVTSQRPEVFRVAYEDTEEVRLVLSALTEAWVRPVDEAGHPIEAEVRPGVLQDDGRVHVRKRSTSARVYVRVPGERGGSVEVPLDGEEHDVVVPRDRRVDVSLLCDQCPGYLTCSVSPHIQGPACEGEGTEYSCLCPAQGEAVLVLRSPSALLDWQEDTQALALVPEGEDSVEVDVRGESGLVRAQLEVPPESSVVVSLRRPELARFQGLYVEEVDGLLEVDSLLPGDWELTLLKVTVHSQNSVHREESRVPFRLEPGEELDLGVVPL